MKYSIIIPTLNEENLIENLLKELCNKQLREKYHFELIISDGGSSDNTINIASNYDIRLIKHNSDNRQNISAGRNIGATHANGEILIFVNADVTCSDWELLFDQVNLCLGENNYSAFTCAVDINDAEKIFADRIFMNFYNYYFHFLNIIGIGMGRGECQVIKKDVFNLVGSYNENIIAGEDFDLFKRVRKIGNIYFSHKVTIYESPRRYRKYGHTRIFLTWLFNSVFVIFRQKSLSKQWEEVR